VSPFANDVPADPPENHLAPALRPGAGRNPLFRRRTIDDRDDIAAAEFPREDGQPAVFTVEDIPAAAPGDNLDRIPFRHFPLPILRPGYPFRGEHSLWDGGPPPHRIKPRRRLLFRGYETGGQHPPQALRRLPAAPTNDLWRVTRSRIRRGPEARHPGPRPAEFFFPRNLPFNHRRLLRNGTPPNANSRPPA